MAEKHSANTGTLPKGSLAPTREDGIKEALANCAEGERSCWQFARGDPRHGKRRISRLCLSVVVAIVESYFVFCAITIIAIVVIVVILAMHVNTQRQHAHDYGHWHAGMLHGAH